MSTKSNFPDVLPMRQRADVIYRSLKGRFAEVMPEAMRAGGIDCWLILCQEDNLDPIYTTLIPMDCWCPILSMLLIVDRGDHVEGFNLSATNTHDLYTRPYSGQIEQEQWNHLNALLADINPRRIGINTGSTQWAAGGLTHNLYLQLTERLPQRFVERFVPAEPAAIHWLTRLTGDDLLMYEHVCALGHRVIAESYSRASIIPGQTSIDDLPWIYWQKCADLGVTVAFKPYFRLIRKPALRERFVPDDRIIRPGDIIHCDVGLNYLRFNSDHQQLAYVLAPGETAAPAGLRSLLSEAHRLQEIYMSEFLEGVSGNELLATVLNRARAEGLPNPKVYSHSVGLFLHEPGPLIGLPWEQVNCPGRGDVKSVSQSEVCDGLVGTNAYVVGSLLGVARFAGVEVMARRSSPVARSERRSAG